MKKLLLFICLFCLTTQPLMQAMQIRGKDQRRNGRRQHFRGREKEMARRDRSRGRRNFRETRSAQSDDDKAWSTRQKQIERRERTVRALEGVRIHATEVDDPITGESIEDYVSNHESLEDELADPKKYSILSRALCYLMVGIPVLCTALAGVAAGTGYGIYRAINTPTQRANDLEASLARVRDTSPLQAAYYWQCTDLALQHDIEGAKQCAATSEYLVDRYEDGIDFLGSPESATIIAPPPSSPSLDLYSVDGISIDPTSDPDVIEIQTEKSLIQRSENTMRVTFLTGGEEKIVVVKKDSETGTFTLLPMPPGTPTVTDYDYIPEYREKVKLHTKIEEIDFTKQ